MVHRRDAELVSLLDLGILGHHENLGESEPFSQLPRLIVADGSIGDTDDPADSHLFGEATPPLGDLE